MNKSFNFFSIAAGITLLVLLIGAMYSLFIQAISFAEFGTVVAIPLSAMTGWAAKAASVQPAEENTLLS